MSRKTEADVLYPVRRPTGTGTSGKSWRHILLDTVARNEKWLVGGLLVGAVLIRALWCQFRSTSGAAGEAARVAAAIGDGRGFADAYRIGQGATAHLTPVSPGIAGLVYRLFGNPSSLSEALLFCWAIGLIIATFYLLYQTFTRLGVSIWGRLAALAFCCFAPTYFGQEAVDFRVWDGGISIFLSAWMLRVMVEAECDGGISVRSASLLTLVGALLFFTNSPVGVAYLACAAVLFLRRLPLRLWPVPVMVGAITLALLVTPWAMRNQRMLGQPVLLRSNAGLELAIGLYPGQLHASDRGAEFMARLNDIHPALGPVPYHKMQAAGGEVAYAHALGAQTMAWARNHPIEVAKLMALHVRQTIAPQPWQFAAFGSGGFTTGRAFLTQVAGIAGMLGLILALVRRRRGWWLPALALMLLLVLAAPFQPVKRYTYLVYPLFVFAAGSLIDVRRSPGLRKKMTREVAA
ncbi:hypothetical protein [Sphingomonas sp. MA1305]|uniref:hypothetical protein n=1 Tax=Sphingomonas sp. MA1305 TaxID=2479204 RepID=UPI0018E01662|nr:hypothetical protein [Sphingomonas sp. MA1305]